MSQIRHDGQITSVLTKTCQAPNKKYSAFTEYPNQWHMLPPSRSVKRGRFARSSRTSGRDAMDAAMPRFLRDDGKAAYGEVVWSWRRDRGVYPAGCSGLTTVTINAAHRGEHEVNRKTIARGKPGCLGCTCGGLAGAACSLLPPRLRAQSAPGFPCALFSRRGTTRLQSSGENAPRDAEGCPLTSSFRAKRSDEPVVTISKRLRRHGFSGALPTRAPGMTGVAV